MRTILITLLILALATPASARRRSRGIATGTKPQLNMSFTGMGIDTGGDALLDAGNITRTRGPNRRMTARSTVTTHTFGIRVERAGGENSGSVTVRAFLEASDPRWSIRIDGKTIGTMPLVIDPTAPIGQVRMHTMELDIPTAMPEGTVFNSVVWEITTN
ncbi:MAG TPA: hypothetical protein VEK79_02245 [Thermoanaerobaculia bacterium]|nr:hypothetical protein [Thermoanaerobaculia bacterium]